ncbi:MAG TPA: Rieske (2Fe-2S) protein [Candidatus Polarisedimenticolia bacterium]|nr:Rieske (2Fe-2S) protein [Candidatus Polarisedimenticolia bacterium]
MERSERRSFLARLLMMTGLGMVVASTGAIAARYLYPLKALKRRRTIFLAPANDIPAGKGRPYRLPDGGTALVTDTGQGIVALSDVCPHLGCKVHYDSAQGRFLCPCHGGVFEKDGRAIAGPPADEGKNLKRYAVSHVGDNLFVEIEETVQL